MNNLCILNGKYNILLITSITVNYIRVKYKYLNVIFYYTLGSTLNIFIKIRSIHFFGISLKSSQKKSILE